VAPGTLVAGIPAKEKRVLDEQVRRMGRDGAAGYVRNARRHMSATPVEE